MADHRHHSERSRDLSARTTAIMVALWMVMGAAALHAPASTAADSRKPIGLNTVDPNIAPWWELTVLPRIGETIARRIVRFRTSSASDPLRVSGSWDDPDPNVDEPTFASPADLQRVRGIGPKTVERIAPWLRFEKSPPY